jgi:hypothetical protein
VYARRERVTEGRVTAALVPAFGVEVKEVVGA